MGSEITAIAREVDVAGLIEELRGQPGLLARAQAVRYVGRTACLWGRILTGVSDEMWAEAQDEADSGDGTIETIETASGGQAFDAIVFHGPYRELVLASLRQTGEPFFHYESTFDSLDLTPGGTRLRLSFDRATRASGGLVPAPMRFPDGVSYIATAVDWMARDGQDTVADHVAVVGVLDILARHAELEVFDDTGYWDHRDEAFLIAAMAEDRRLRAELRAALASYDFSDRGAAPEPSMTIARLLGEKPL